MKDGGTVNCHCLFILKESLENYANVTEKIEQLVGQICMYITTWHG